MSKGLLAGKVAVVTGAGRGIGRAVALAYGKAGAEVWCTARTIDEISAAAGEIREVGGVGHAFVADVADRESVKALMTSVGETSGGIDLLVVNAGTNIESMALEDTDVDRWQEVINVNLVGAVNSISLAIPLMKGRVGAKIITVGSGVGRRGLIGKSAYACSKAALWMLTRVAAQELAGDGITVNELIPGPVDTRMSGDTSDSERPADWSSEWRKKPEDVAPLALFLATQPDQGPTAQSFSLMRREQ
jgi:3-oxoacyl-[acyl-carrier protein] reductase